MPSVLTDDAIEPWRVISPMEHAIGAEPVIDVLGAGYTAAMAGVAVVALVAALPLSGRRDLAAA